MNKHHTVLLTLFTNMQMAVHGASPTYLETKRKDARARFGRPFAFEQGTEFQINAEPYLTRWLRDKERA